MALLLVDQGKVMMLQALFDKGLTLRLYKVDRIPTRTDVEADYTECDFEGYTPKNLVAENWIITEGNPSDAKYPTQEFELLDDAAVSQTAYGYYVTQVGTAKLVYVEPFAVPVILSLAGQGCLVELHLELSEKV